MPKFKNCVIINIDGCRRDLLYSLIDDGKLPIFRYIFKSGLRFTSATTIFPTATFPTQASAVTGAYPARHGIISNMWMDRMKEGSPCYNYTENFFHAANVYKYSLFGFPSIIFADNLENGFADNHLSPDVKTVYQEAKGNDFTSLVAFHPFIRGADYWIRPKPIDLICYFFGNIIRELFSVFDESMISRTLKKIENVGVPNILFLYFAPSDGTSHWWGEEGQKWYLTGVVDGKLARVIKLLEKKGTFDSTLFVLFADHGHSDLVKDREHCIPYGFLTDVIKKSTGYDSISKLKSAGNNVVAALEGGMTGLYIKDRVSKDWHTLPAAGQLEPICLEFLRQSKGRLGAAVYRDVDTAQFRIIIEENPMEINPDEILKKINREYYSPLAPDVMIFSNYRDGYHFYRDPLSANHGNISADDLNIPIIFSGNGIKCGENREEVSIVDIAPTIANKMGFSMESADGRILKV